MAKRKGPELSPEAVAANADGEARREREKRERARNNEKQKRFRESMKAEGYKQVLLWDVPCPVDVRERMTAVGFRQVPAWEIENLRPGETRQEKRRGDPGRVKIAHTVRECAVGVADQYPEVREAVRRALLAFEETLKGISPEAVNAPIVDGLYKDFEALIRPMGDPWKEM